MKRERYSHLIDLDTIVPLSANEFAKRGLIPRARLAEFAKGDGLKTLRARILPCLRIIENTARKTAHRNINLDGTILHNWEDHYFMLYPSTRYALVTNDRNMLQAAQGTNHAKLVCRLEEAPSLFQGGA